MDIKEKIFSELKRHTRKSFSEDTIIKDLSIDSLDLLMLVTELEKVFSIAISDEELLNIKKVGDILRIVNQKMQK
ncbi:acyl carrier protein [Metamycoplasma hyosynoviae]|uniref:Acyl carrier protein n=2 Tax=Metamycoplasma hyosynoviae TaxID=29559 RepID=A0A063YBG3_9BACT|nr:acyl carrier protein [Metamycoplasma hyosynoviae]ASI54068.1 acyl carrier protein [Metamycoplasma hyosynoviae]KDE41652.1 acyl carrier protein [Metamycoplasma hyosynoviae]KDE41749.1 acyl carrier protein [Metamycoplasma hyosynoviae]KDE43853.1 acyl carrier protein [Metamycoplasma hyosynoviae]KDE44468.1 acyl carrier protein [Metamycoplasma hyosynoviae]